MKQISTIRVMLTFKTAFVLVTFQIAAWSNKYQKSWIEKVEERLSVTSSILGDMRAIKMLGLSDKLFNIIDRLRQAEISESVKFRRMLISQIFFCKSYLSPFYETGRFLINFSQFTICSGTGGDIRRFCSYRCSTA
jgi:hypothetical protein